MQGLEKYVVVVVFPFTIAVEFRGTVGHAVELSTKVRTGFEFRESTAKSSTIIGGICRLAKNPLNPIAQARKPRGMPTAKPNPIASISVKG